MDRTIWISHCDRAALAQRISRPFTKPATKVDSASNLRSERCLQRIFRWDQWDVSFALMIAFRGQQVPNLKNPEKAKAIKKKGKTHASGAVPDQRSRPHLDRCNRRRNGPSGAQRIRPRSEPVSHRETVRPARFLSSAPADERY